MKQRARRLSLALSTACLASPLAVAQDVLRLVDVGPILTSATIHEHGRRVDLVDFFASYELRSWSHEAGPSVVQYSTAGEWEVSDASDSGDRFTATFFNSGIPNAQGAVIFDRQGNHATCESPSGMTGTNVFTMSGDGDFAGGSYRFNVNDDYAACIWDHLGTANPIGGLPGGNGSGWVRSLNDDGSMAVGFSDDGSSFVLAPFLWTSGGGVQPLDPIAPGMSPVAISGDGNVIIGITGGSSNERAARVVLGQPVEVLVPATGFSRSEFVNRDGSVVVGRTAGGTVIGRPSYSGPFVWFEGSGAYAIEDALANAGVSVPANFDVATTIGLAPDGDAILIEAGSAPGNYRTYVAYIDEPNLPIGTSECGPAVANSTGSPASIDANGFGYAFGPGFELRGSNLPATSLTMFLASQTSGFAAMPGGSQGNLCLGGSIGRFRGPGELQFADASGDAAMTVDPTNVAQPTERVTIFVGETWRFQAWYRDANPNATSNFTDAVAITFD